jgi:DNA-binding response OmpR family regulator
MWSMQILGRLHLPALAARHVAQGGGLPIMNIAANESPSARRLLVLDDELSICDFVRRVAETAGFEVATAGNYDEFRAAYDSFNPSGIIFDLVMPNVDGIALMEILAKEECKTPLVIMSGYHAELLKSGRRLGDDYELNIRGTLSKPFGIAELLDAMSWLTDPGPAS